MFNRDSDSMEVDLKSDPRLDQPGYVMNVALGKVNICHEISLKFPMIELWLEFPHGNMLQRKLIGRSKSSYFCEDGQAFNLSIYDIATLQEVVQVKMAYFWGEDGWKLEENVQHSLDSYAVNPDMSEAAPEEKTDHFDMNLRDSLDSQLSMDSLSNDNLLADISQIKENLVDLHYQPAFTTLPPMKTMAKSRQSFESTHSVEENDEDYIALLNPKKPQYGSQPEHIAKKTTKSVSTTSSNGAHVLDIALHGNCVLQEAGESQDLLPIMGCHVCYALPNIHDQDTTNARKLVISEGSLTESVSMFSVWWDAECAILNSTNRHRFESTIDQNNIASALGINPNVGIIYYLVDCDENGNLPKDILPFAKAVLGMDRLCEVLQSNVTEKLIKLPIQYLEDRHRHLVHAYLVLKFSHRCEPVLLNRSQDGKSILQEASREEKHEDKEPSVSANLHNSILPISSNQAKPHHVDFIVDVDQFSHLRLPNNSVKGNLFFSLSVVKDYKTNVSTDRTLN